ncbi:MAG: hypothetical protein QXX79_03380 [Candidatus Bathyarchaeia archaeon]
MLKLFYKYWKTHRLLLVAAIIVVVGVAASGIMFLFMLPAYEWPRMVQTLSSHAQRLTIYYVIPPQGKNITIDRFHPQFQTILDLISGSSFVRKWDIAPPYAILLP